MYKEKLIFFAAQSGTNYQESKSVLFEVEVREIFRKDRVQSRMNEYLIKTTSNNQEVFANPFEVRLANDNRLVSCYHDLNIKNRSDNIPTLT